MIKETQSQDVQRNCNSLAYGQDVSIWYSVADPEYVTFVTPDQAASAVKSEIGNAILIGYPFFVLFLLAARRFSV